MTAAMTQAKALVPPETVALDIVISLQQIVLRELKVRKMPKQELARRMGVSPQQVSRLLYKADNMTLVTAAKLALALDTSLTGLLAAAIARRTLLEAGEA